MHQCGARPFDSHLPPWLFFSQVASSVKEVPNEAARGLAISKICHNVKHYCWNTERVPNGVRSYCKVQSFWSVSNKGTNV